MSDTPRTKGPMEYTRPATEFEIMQQEFIEQLKRELTERDALIERLKCCTNCGHYCCPNRGDSCLRCLRNMGLCDAERGRVDNWVAPASA